MSRYVVVEASTDFHDACSEIEDDLYDFLAGNVFRVSEMKRSTESLFNEVFVGEYKSIYNSNTHGKYIN